MMPHRVMQRNRHEPEKGIIGDCHRACYASILGVELDAIPHFFDKDRTMEDALPFFESVWREFGIMEIEIPFYGELDDILKMLNTRNPGVPFILCGQSRNLVNHSVICMDGAIWHDPSIDQSGIIGPSKPDDLWWVTYIVGDYWSLSSEPPAARVVGS